ncbi:tetratricopeptide repeat protein [Nautilia sp.]
MKYIENECMKGNAFACGQYGQFYYEKKNYAKAAKLYKKACDGGSVEGCGNLGLLYGNGKGVPKYYYKAYEYLMKAAKKGYSASQNNLDISCEEYPWVCK